MRSQLPYRLPSWAFRAIGFVGLLSVAISFGAPVLRAQALPAGKVAPGMDIYATFQGSVSSSGSIYSMTNTVSYNFTRQLSTDVNVPVNFVEPPAQSKGIASSVAGIGNISVDGRMGIPLPFVDYSPTVTIAFPTGSTTQGFSTGSVTYDLDNRFEHSWGLLTPFLDVDIGNSLNSGSTPVKRVISRPYLTLGKVAEFTAGPQIELTDKWTISGDFYDVTPWGPQTVFSRIVAPGTSGSKTAVKNRVFEIATKTVGGAKLVDDNGYDVSVEFSPNRFIDLTLAFDRSVHYALNTISFSIGFNVSQMLSRPREE